MKRPGSIDLVPALQAAAIVGAFLLAFGWGVMSFVGALS
jgi:hypothetical protein